MDKREGPGLCQGVFRLVDLTVDSEDMVVQIVSHQTDTAHRQYIVDVLHIVGHLLVLFLQLLDVVLQRLVRMGHLRDVTSGTIDAEQLVLAVAQGRNLQLVVHQVAIQQFVERTVVVRIVPLV